MRLVGMVFAPSALHTDCCGLRPSSVDLAFRPGWESTYSAALAYFRSCSLPRSSLGDHSCVYGYENFPYCTRSAFPPVVSLRFTYLSTPPCFCCHSLPSFLFVALLFYLLHSYLIRSCSGCPSFVRLEATSLAITPALPESPSST